MDPRSDPATSGSQYNGKLSGDYHWPFSISLPKEIALPDPTGKHGEVRTYQLPQTFLERSTRASVYYELFVHIARSTFRVDNKCALPVKLLHETKLAARPDSRLCSSTSLRYDRKLALFSSLFIVGFNAKQ